MNAIKSASKPPRRISAILCPGIRFPKVAVRRGTLEISVNRAQWRQMAARGEGNPAQGIASFLRADFGV